MKQENVIKILFVEDSVDEAEQVISLLRNHGIAVRPARATNEAELEAALGDVAPDVVLANPATADLGLAEVARCLDASGKDFSLVALLPGFDEEAMSTMFGLGVRAMVLRSRPDQVPLVVQREFDALSTRRAVRSLESALRECERRCDALLDSSRDPIAYVHEGMHVRANRAYLEMFGCETFEDLEGLTLLDMIAAEHAEDFKALLKRLAQGEKLPQQSIEVKAVRSDGGVFEATMECSAASFEGERCLQIVFRRQVMDEGMVEQLQRDPGTGLYHRARMLELIGESVAAAARGTTGQALLVVEPDNWKAIVDAIGMSNTDHLMAALAARIGERIRAYDSAGRLGEHTIGVLLHEQSDAGVQAVIDRLMQAADEGIFEAGSHSITLSLSVGGSLIGEKNANTQQLLEQADKALRSAQTQGSSRREIYDPAAREKAEAERERHWLEVLQKALTEDEGFVLYYQQIVSLQDVPVEFFEILLRMNGPSGEVAPGYFLPAAERHGLMPQVDRWVLDRAITALAEREREGRVATFFVKLTTQSLTDAELLSWMESRLQSAGVRRNALVLEMPESRVLTSLKPAQDFVAQLKRIGVAFALEQFGSGLNPFQTLKHVDADYLKIDRSFMAELPQHPENRAKIAEICVQARELEKLTVAEWVEDAASTSLLFACGVDFVQGNFLQEPEKVISLDSRAA
jgi:diguanylate cyclase (GGDEF)-like protein/PAS domain S-box-containing protein